MSIIKINLVNLVNFIDWTHGIRLTRLAKYVYVLRIVIVLVSLFLSLFQIAVAFELAIGIGLCLVSYILPARIIVPIKIRIKPTPVLVKK